MAHLPGTGHSLCLSAARTQNLSARLKVHISTDTSALTAPPKEASSYVQHGALPDAARSSDHPLPGKAAQSTEFPDALCFRLQARSLMPDA